MDSILIVSGTKKGEEYLREMISACLRASINRAESGSETRRMLLNEDFDYIFINTPLKDEFGHELALKCAESAAAVMMIVKNELADSLSAKVESSGVFVLPKPVSRPFFYQSVRLMTSLHTRLMGMKRENVLLQQKIEEIRLIDRAKCTLMQYLKFTEAQAHHYIEKQAMDLRLTKKDIAQSILQTYED